MSVTVRVGGIGVGVMGADHARNLHTAVSGAEVSAICDFNRDTAGSVADTIPGAQVFDDGPKLIDSATVDAIVIASHQSRRRLCCVCQSAREFVWRPRRGLGACDGRPTPRTALSRRPHACGYLSAFLPEMSAQRQSKDGCSPAESETCTRLVLVAAIPSRD